MVDKPNLHTWPTNRTERRYHVRVVEPDKYEPTGHLEIFNAAIGSLLGATPSRMDRYEPHAEAPQLNEPFDLVTFPEAFLTEHEIVEVLAGLTDFGSIGCIHVGLHAANGRSHLFSPAKLGALLAELEKIVGLEKRDLEAFRTWLRPQWNGARFNVACLFTVDANRAIRVCLHPKAVAAGVELSPFSEANMTGADLLSLVILQPVDPTLQSVVIQPLICADALLLETDRPDRRPMERLERHSLEPGLLPDHIDVVSIVACTPQVFCGFPSPDSRRWQHEFKLSFESAAKDDRCRRHHFAVFVLANFRTVGEAAGGLSGVFVPIPMRDEPIPHFVDVTAFGRPKAGKTDNSWSDGGTCPEGWSTLGHIASLNALLAFDTVARMFGFTVNRLPRDTTRWRLIAALSNYTVRYAHRDGSDLVFQDPE